MNKSIQRDFHICISVPLKENNCIIIQERERLLIHLVKPATKEEKMLKYDVNTHETVLV